MISTIVLSCLITYTPTKAEWAREVAIDYSNKAVVSVRVDGQKVYAFSASGNVLKTALDNEQIAIDVKRGQWRSDFRGLAYGLGACERN